jgi:GT2 family glycosyltransferase
MTSVAVLVPTWRRPHHLARCLEALRGQREKPDRVLVVRRPEDEATGEVLAAVNGGLRVEEVVVHEAGQVAALNAGLERVTEDIVAITDDDTAPWPDWIERITAYFERDPELGGLGGRDWLYHAGELQSGSRERVGRVAPYGRFLSFHHLGVGARREVDFLKGANMSFRRRAVGALRFDRTLRGSGAEYLNDWAFSLAVKRSGWKLEYDPQVAVDHFEGRRTDSDPRSVGGSRDRAERRVAAERAFNESYMAVRHLSGPLALTHLAFAISVGTTAAPAPVLALLRYRQLGGARAAAIEVANSMRARLSGAVVGFRRRMQDRRQG